MRDETKSPVSTGKPRRSRTISKKEARAFIKRWRAVNAVEIAELRAASVEEKLRQLAALMESVDQMGWTDALRAEEDVVRERWIQLRHAYGV